MLASVWSVAKGDSSNRLQKFVYEFFGTAILSYAFNISSYSATSALLLVSVIAWEVAEAHFNMAITIADFIQKTI
jgi:glycerol uptake facilitator-like aquaporin